MNPFKKQPCFATTIVRAWEGQPSPGNAASPPPRSYTQGSHGSFVHRGSYDEVKRDTSIPLVLTCCVCVRVCVCVRASEIGTMPEVQVSHQPSCCFSG